MNEAKNRIRIFVDEDTNVEYEGDYYIYREDFVKEGCVHFKDGEGKHHRVYGGTVIIDEE